MPLTPNAGDPIEALYQARDATQFAASYAASLPTGTLQPELGAYGPVITSTLDELYGLINTLSRASRGQPGVTSEAAQLVHLQHALGIAVVIAHGF